MQIFIGADHGGFQAKQILLEWLRSLGHQVTDCGAQTLDPLDDYPDFAFAVAEKVASNLEVQARGIIICRSGAGAVIAANKISKIKAAVAVNETMAQHARMDNDINVLGLGADQINENEMKKIIEVFLETPFSNQERHLRRLQKITDQES